jgi:hypothetical protein
MLQNIEGRNVYVVDLDELPVTMLPIHDGDNRLLRPYADALDDAIRNGIVTQPGKYGIWINAFGTRYEIFRIVE